MEKTLDFDKLNGLVPAIIQEPNGGKVLMTGFMNPEALDITRKTGKVTFFSRTRNTIWTKGETSGNFLMVKNIFQDCDNDTLLIYAEPTGPVCHTGDPTCFVDDPGPGVAFLAHLQKVIHGRKGLSADSSYTARLFEKGVSRIAQKVGEEAVECVIEAMKGDNEKFLEEASDLVYHLMVLLSNQGLDINDVAKLLESRHK
jgi:phosphoribosyl-AMP cyclohydrolase / phosphoribosyl-ATP pyrophosphohydrolase